eukprot:1282832-Pyramimonas_sp.AAC.2
MSLGVGYTRSATWMLATGRIQRTSTNTPDINKPHDRSNAGGMWAIAPLSLTTDHDKWRRCAHCTHLPGEPLQLSTIVVAPVPQQTLPRF